MKLNFSRILEILFPLSDDEKIIAQYNTTSFLEYRDKVLHNDVYALASFSNTVVRSAIHLNKFHAHPHAQALLAALLTHELVRLSTQPYILIPIPLSNKRMRERGYNQVTNVATKALSEITNITLRTDILIKHIHTTTQTSLSRDERLRNLKGAFEVIPTNKSMLAGGHIILVDDVITTGATLHEAKAVLMLHKPASITCIALAH